VLFEDEGVLALDKPFGWLSHAEAGQRSVLQWAHQRAGPGPSPSADIRLVHRLDQDTSGVIILAKNPAMAAALGEMFEKRKILKSYLALTWPVPALRWVRVEHRLQPQRIDGGEMMRVVEHGGQEACSEIEVLARGRRYGLVRALPEHGRKHQVRVALADLAAPIVGDFLYGGRGASRRAKRLMLHARGLELAHPKTGEHLCLYAAVPRDMVQLLEEDGGRLPSQLDRRHRTLASHRERKRQPRRSRSKQRKRR
jgi:RluA family pseudouridine synthase